MKKIRKILASTFLFATRVFMVDMIFRAINRKKILIYMLHGVVDDSDLNVTAWKPLGRHMRQGEFKKSLLTLANKYTFISLEQAVKIINGECPPVNNAAVLTFDDGMLNAYQNVNEVLTEMKIPATFYVATSYADKQKSYWFHSLDYAIQKNNGLNEILNADKNLSERVKGFKGKKKIFSQIKKYLKTNYPNDYDLQKIVESMILSIDKSLPDEIDKMAKKDPWLGVMGWKEIKAMRDNGFEIGSHTINHVRLDGVSEEDMRKELKQSKEIICKELIEEGISFCYPNGNYNNVVINCVKETGYTSAVTGEPGLNQIGENLMALKRINFPAKYNKQKLLLQASGLYRYFL